MTRDGMVHATQVALGWVNRCEGMRSPFRARLAAGDQDPKIFAEVAGELAFTPGRPAC